MPWAPERARVRRIAKICRLPRAASKQAPSLKAVGEKRVRPRRKNAPELELCAFLL